MAGGGDRTMVYCLGVAAAFLGMCGGRACVSPPGKTRLFSKRDGWDPTPQGTPTFHCLSPSQPGRYRRKWACVFGRHRRFEHSGESGGLRRSRARPVCGATGGVRFSVPPWRRKRKQRHLQSTRVCDTGHATTLVRLNTIFLLGGVLYAWQVVVVCDPVDQRRSVHSCCCCDGGGERLPDLAAARLAAGLWAPGGTSSQMRQRNSV